MTGDKPKSASSGQEAYALCCLELEKNKCIPTDTKHKLPGTNRKNQVGCISTKNNDAMYEPTQSLNTTSSSICAICPTSCTTRVVRLDPLPFHDPLAFQTPTYSKLSVQGVQFRRNALKLGTSLTSTSVIVVCVNLCHLWI